MQGPLAIVGASRKSPSRHFVGALCLALVAAVLVMLSTGSLSSGAATKAKPVKPDFAYFKGKTITYMVPFAAVGISALEPQVVMPEIAKYLHATINIEYSNGAGSIFQNDVAAAKPNDLTIGSMTVASDLNSIFSGTSTLTFSPTAVTNFGSFGTPPYLDVACDTSSITSFAQVTGGTTPILDVNSNLSALNLIQHVILNVYGVPHTWLNGYTGATAAVGCERGDGNLSLNSTSDWFDAAGTALTPGITPLLLTGPVPKGSPEDFLNTEVPTLAAFVKAHPPASATDVKAINAAIAFSEDTAPQISIFGPKGIPAKEALAMSDAFKTVMAYPSVKKALLVDGLVPGYISVAAVQKFIASQVKLESFYSSFLNH
jgi:hypothetical protein